MKKLFQSYLVTPGVRTSAFAGLVCCGCMLSISWAADCTGDKVEPPPNSTHVDDCPGQVILEAQDTFDNDPDFEGCIAGALTLSDENFEFLDYQTSGQESDQVEDESCLSGYRVVAYDSVYSIGTYTYEGELEVRDEDPNCPECAKKPSGPVSGSIESHSGPATNMSSAVACGCVPVWV